MEAGDEPPACHAVIPDFRHHQEDPGQANPGTHGESASRDAGNAGGYERAEPRDAAPAEHAGQVAEEQGEGGLIGIALIIQPPSPRCCLAKLSCLSYVRMIINLV